MKRLFTLFLILMFIFSSSCLAVLKDKTYFQNTYNLDDDQMFILMVETDNLTKYVDLVDSALKDGSYLEYRDCVYYYHPKLDFKENYDAFLIMKKNGELNKEEISEILRVMPDPALSLNIYKYRGDKVYKVNKVLNNKKLASSDKYDKILKLSKYKKASFKEVKTDFKERLTTLGIAMTGFGLALLTGIPGKNGNYIEYQFKL